MTQLPSIWDMLSMINTFMLRVPITVQSSFTQETMVMSGTSTITLDSLQTHLQESSVHSLCLENTDTLDKVSQSQTKKKPSSLQWTNIWQLKTQWWTTLSLSNTLDKSMMLKTMQLLCLEDLTVECLLLGLELSTHLSFREHLLPLHQFFNSKDGMRLASMMYWPMILLQFMRIKDVVWVSSKDSKFSVISRQELVTGKNFQL